MLYNITYVEIYKYHISDNKYYTTDLYYKLKGKLYFNYQ